MDFNGLPEPSLRSISVHFRALLVARLRATARRGQRGQAGIVPDVAVGRPTKDMDIEKRNSLRPFLRWLRPRAGQREYRSIRPGEGPDAQDADPPWLIPGGGRPARSGPPLPMILRRRHPAP